VLSRTRAVSVGWAVVLVSLMCLASSVPAPAQQTLGSISGVVTDTTGAAVPRASVSIRDVATNLVVTSETKADGSFSAFDLPIGNYEVTFTKSGFEKVVYPKIVVQGGLTTTLNASLQPGQVTVSITVEATPLLNQTDTSNGYTLGSNVIESVPLGTGSFTQLAVLGPGTSADFLSGSGTNEGLGNQAIVANGQRDTSNSFTFNSVNADNLLNGNTTSNIGDSRFTLNTGEIFGTSGQVQTNTSVFDSIGEGLPTPPVETIQELQVTTSMYDASMGQNAGAHIELTTKSGTNDYHGQAYGYLQNSALDAKPTFLSPSVIATYNGNTPPLHRDVWGGALGGPIVKDKLFFFASYQRQFVSDALSGATSGVPTLNGLTDTNRDAQDLVDLVNYDAGLTPTPTTTTCTNNPAIKVKCISVAQVDPVALALFSQKTKSGQFVIPSQVLPPESTGETPDQEYNTLIRGPASVFTANQANGNADYNFSSNDRLSAKYYFQRNPTSAPFAVSETDGFPQILQAGSQVFSLENSAVLTPNTTWEQRFGFIRQFANAETGQPFGPSAIGLTLPSSSDLFPGINIENADVGATVASGGVVDPLKGNEMKLGPSTNFANAGVFQNLFEWSSKYSWVIGRHTLAFGGTYDYTQFNVDNRENDVAVFTFRDFEDFLTGTLGSDKSSGTLLDGETDRHFRARQAGLFAQDTFKLTSKLSITYGLRWDWDGPLYETNGLLTNFYPADYNYDLATDSFNPINGTPGIGIVVAGNNPTFGTKGVSDSTLTGRQWGFAPRFGVAWSPVKNFVVRAGWGMFYDRGEYFSELSASAGLGISGPFSVTTQEPFTIPLTAHCASSVNCFSSAPFGTALPPTPTSLAAVAALVPNMEAMADCVPGPVPGLEQPNQPWCTVSSTGTTAFPFLFGGYDPKNKLPYSENWSLDLQWQPRNDLVMTLGYLGNRGVHQVLPIPFNQPGIATPANPINNQIYSFGQQATGVAPEEVQTQIGEFSFSDGNTALRTPFIGINPNADLWTGDGISFYNALQVGITKNLSHGLQLNAAYTYSHTLDEGSGIGAGLFFNGNNPLDPRSSYASADFDRTHVFIISYVYNFPQIKNASGLWNFAANGWGITGVTVAQSGEPFSVIDFSGAAGGIYFSSDDFVTNPLLPLQTGVTPQEAESTQVINGASGGRLIAPSPNPNNEAYVNPNAFMIPYLLPGQDGVPPGDTIETGYGTTGRNVFRAPFQTVFNFSVFKNFKINERITLRYQFDAFNLFNQPNLDSPDTDFELDPCFNPQPCYYTNPGTSLGYGVISETVGSNRFLQMSLHLVF
jgi:Carboxypeptidase regulatory-like domain